MYKFLFFGKKYELTRQFDRILFKKLSVYTALLPTNREINLL